MEANFWENIFPLQNFFFLKQRKKLQTNYIILLLLYKYYTRLSHK